jgi:hypothetical protein
LKLPLCPALTLVVVLLSSPACQKTSTSGVQIGHDEAKLVPPETQAMAGVDLAALKAAPIYQRHASMLDIPLMEGASGNIGLDPRRDIKSLLVSFTGDQTIAIASGSFSRASIQQKLLANGAHSSKYAEQTLLSSGTGAVSFPRDGVAVAGPAASVRSALEAQENKTRGVPSPLQSRLELLSANDQLWFVSNGPLPMQRLAGMSGIASALSSLAGFVNASAVGLHADSGLHLTANLSCVSEKGAQQVRDALRGMVGLARLTTKEGDLDLLRAYDTIQVSQEGKNVRVQADISPELSEKLLTRLPDLRGSVGALSR